MPDQPNDLTRKVFRAEIAAVNSHLAETGPSAPADADLRYQVLHALDFAYCNGIGYETPEQLLDAYDAHQAVLPAPADRAAVLREAAVELRKQTLLHDDCVCVGELRRMADEAQQAEAPLRAELKPWQLLGDVPDEPLPQTERLVGGRRLARDGAQQTETPKRPPMDPVHILGIGADEAQQAEPEAPRQWCKCRSCWGWFVVDHPGEDLDELGKDLRWWSGLPEHRDPPADAFAAASCPHGVGPGDGSGCIKPAGHDGDHVVTAGVTVLPCSRAELHQPHMPHSWWPQPGMAYVHCLGATTKAQQAGEGR